jgi:hypothetical protein
MAYTDTVIDPLFEIPDQTIQNFVHVLIREEAEHRVYIYSGGTNDYEYLSKWNNIGALISSAIPDADGSGVWPSVTGMSGPTKTPLALAPGGQYIVTTTGWNAPPDATTGLFWTVFDRETLAYVQHSGHNVGGSSVDNNITHIAIDGTETFAAGISVPLAADNNTRSIYHIPSNSFLTTRAGQLAFAAPLQDCHFDNAGKLWYSSNNGKLARYGLTEVAGVITATFEATYTPYGDGDPLMKMTNIPSLNRFILWYDSGRVAFWNPTTCVLVGDVFTMDSRGIVNESGGNLSFIADLMNWREDPVFCRKIIDTQWDFALFNRETGVETIYNVTLWPDDPWMPLAYSLTYEPFKGAIWSPGPGTANEGLGLYFLGLEGDAFTPVEGDDDPAERECPAVEYTVRQLLPFEQRPFNEYRVGDARSKFPITFRVMVQADLRVTVNDIELEQADFTFTGKLVRFPGWDDADAIQADPNFIEKNNPYPGFKGGYVTLDTAVEDAVVRIWSDPAPARDTDYLTGELIMAALNRSFETPWVRQRAQHLIRYRYPTVGFVDPTDFEASQSGSLILM